jgi:DNA repair ATPase RecN
MPYDECAVKLDEVETDPAILEDPRFVKTKARIDAEVGPKIEEAKKKAEEKRQLKKREEKLQKKKQLADMTAEVYQFLDWYEAGEAADSFYREKLPAMIRNIEGKIRRLALQGDQRAFKWMLSNS